MMNRIGYFCRFILLMLCVSLVIGFLPGCTKKQTSDRLFVYFPSLGQGDCTVFVTPHGKTVIVDAGPAGSSDDLCAFLLKEKIRTVDLLILTHAHADHIGGAAAIFDFCDVRSVWYTPEADDGYLQDELLDAVKQSGAEISDARKGAEAVFDGLSFRVLMRGTDASDPNENCPIIKASFGAVSFLLMADAGKAAEKALLGEDPDILKSDLLKVGHHGSEYGCDPAFLKAVSPAFAVICCDTVNVYAHPHREVPEALEHAGSKVFMTSDGTQTFHSDGKKVYKVE